MKDKEILKDEEYLDEQFPKGETKFRGQAMVLLALARQVGQKAERKRILGKLKREIENLEVGIQGNHITKGEAFNYLVKEIDKLEELKKEVEKQK